MPKSICLTYCFVNSFRYLILALLIACLSILFANVILYSVAVIYDDYQDTQLWRRTYLIQPPSTDKANNVTFTTRTSLLDANTRRGRRSTIRSVSVDLPVSHKHKSSELPSYKSSLLLDKDRQWDSSLKYGRSKSRQQIGVKGIKRVTLEGEIQHFLIWTAPGIGMFCGSFSTSRLLRSFGCRRFFAVMMIVSAAATGLLAMAPYIKYGRYLTASMRFMQGLTLASVFPVIGSVTTNWGTLKEQFVFLICCTSFIQLTPIISWPISSFIFAGDCRTPFFVHAALTLLLTLVWLVIFREEPQYHSLVNGLELNKIVAGKIKVEHNRVLMEDPYLLLVMSLPVWAIWIAAFGYFLVVSVAVQFLPLYCLLITRETHADSAVLAALPFLFMFLMTIFHGLWYRFAKLFSERISLLVFNISSFLICSLVFIFLAIFPPGGTYHHSVITAFTLILCVLSFSLYGFYRSAILVGRFFGQFIVSYIRFFAGFAFFFTAATVVIFVKEKLVL